MRVKKPYSRFFIPFSSISTRRRPLASCSGPPSLSLLVLGSQGPFCVLDFLFTLNIQYESLVLHHTLRNPSSPWLNFIKLLSAYVIYYLRFKTLLLNLVGMI